MIAIDSIQNWLDSNAKHLATQSEPSWLQQQRRAARIAFEQSGLPKTRDEDWRYTNLRELTTQPFQLPIVSELTTNLTKSKRARLVFIDGNYSADHSSTIENIGVSVNNLRTVVNNKTEFLEKHLGSALPITPHGFTLLNSANWQDGYLIHLDGKQDEHFELEICFVSQNERAASYYRNIIIAEPNSECTVIERHIGAEDLTYLNNSITEVIAQSGAHINHYKLGQESDKAFHIGGVFFTQQAQSQTSSHNLHLSGGLTRNDILANLVGQGAHTQMDGLVMGADQQHIDNFTEVNHAVANCTSDEFYKSVLADQSRSVFRGRIIVAQDAQQTSADQQNNNLLLSPMAEADTQPQLEIYADDVQCSHGATVGQLDEKSLFYLRSRGIDEASAKSLLTFAFANEVIERIKPEDIRHELVQTVTGELLNDLEESST